MPHEHDERKAVRKAALAYSGGLDTSIIIPWLKENYGCEVVAVAVDVGQAEETAGLKEKALADGRLRLPPPRREGGVRDGVPLPRPARRRGLRARVPPRHLDRAAPHRREAGRGRAGDRLRRARPRLHREGERPGPLRAGLPGPRAGARRHRAVARVGHHLARGGDRLRGRAEDPRHRDEEGALLARPEPLAHLARGRPPRGPGVRAGGVDVQADRRPAEGARRAGAGDDRVREGLPGR